MEDNNTVKKSERNKISASKKVHENKKYNYKQTFFRFLFHIIMLLIIFLLLFVIGNLFIFNYSPMIINDDTFYKNTNKTNIYDNENNVIMTFDTYDINLTKNEDIPDYYYKALVSLEDKNFYKHKGIDYLSMFKSIIRSLTKDGTYGGSSITMQLAKNIYMEDWMIYDENGYNKHDTNPIQYKLTQMSIALQMEKVYSKEDIITHYANSVFYGDGGYGITNASKTFFNKKPRDLTLRECTMLAAIPNNPYNLSPYSNMDNLNIRVNYGLSQMLDLEYITEEEYEEAMSEEVQIVDKKQNSKSYSYLIDYEDALLKELYDLNPDLNLYTANLDIYTGLDIEKQKEIEKVLKDKSYKEEGVTQAAISIDPNTGLINAIGSGVEDEDILLGYNLAIDAQRQPGSSIKPVLDYAPAIEYLGYTSSSILKDIPTNYSGGSAIKNYSGTYQGDITLKSALAQSLNTTALRLFQEVVNVKGLNWYKTYMKDLGFSDYKDINEAYALGGFQYGTNVLEMAGAYQMFANGGYYNKPHIIKKIEIKEGSPYYSIPEEYLDPIGNYQIDIKKTSKEDEDFEFSMHLKYLNSKKKMISEKTADEITTSLDINYANSLMYHYKPNTKKAVSVKTGTTTDAIDTWTVGYTKDEVIAVWNGFENNKSVNESEVDVRETFQKLMSDE